MLITNMLNTFEYTDVVNDVNYYLCPAMCLQDSFWLRYAMRSAYRNCLLMSPNTKYSHNRPVWSCLQTAPTRPQIIHSVKTDKDTKPIHPTAADTRLIGPTPVELYTCT